MAHKLPMMDEGLVIEAVRSCGDFAVFGKAKPTIIPECRAERVQLWAM
ncbi:hypothetical protein [Mesorhizobium sp.]|nr:hypothetical protein [Mesorhizobium sp.]